MDQLEHILSSMAPGQIEQAVQLLQRYTTAASIQTAAGGHTPASLTSNDTTKDDDEMPQDEDDEEDSDDLSLVALTLKKRREAGNSNNNNNNNNNNSFGAPGDEEKVQKTTPVCGKENEGNNQSQRQEQSQSRHGDGDSPSQSNKKLTKTAGSPTSQQKQQTSASAGASCSLASFGFVSAVKKKTSADCEKNKLFTSFVQDKRIVPTSLRFWCHDKDAAPTVAVEGEEGKEESIPPFLRDDEEKMDERDAIELDENSSSLMHSPVMGCGDNEGLQNEQQYQHQHGNRARCYASFTSMIEAATTATTNNGDDKKDTVKEELLQCPCNYHVNIDAPRTGFRNEVIFSGFYAVGYDPCQSRPPYFGTYNCQDSLNIDELLHLARFDAGKEMPQMSNLDYDYDSGDDWDVVDGDEDLGASSSDTEDDEENANSSTSITDGDFTNDSDDGDDDDSDAELQRRMVEDRQRRLQRLRHKDKLVPAFSGPFVGIPVPEHPLRNFDRLERVGSALDGDTFAAIIEQELRGMSSAMLCPSHSGANNNSSNTNNNGGVGENVIMAEPLDERRLEQRLVAAALRNRREMLPQEVDAVHAIIAANAKIYPKAIVEALQGQQLCVGVARAEILRTIRRYYDRTHNTMVRRAEPWSPTDERLFTTRPLRQKTTGGQVGTISNNKENVIITEHKHNKTNENNNNSNDNDEEEEAENYEGDEDVPLVLAFALKRTRADSEGVEGERL